VSHLNLSPPITRLGGQVSKKVSYKSCRIWTSWLNYDLDFDLDHVLIWPPKRVIGGDGVRW